MVSNAREDFPEPERPVKTTSRSRGRSKETSWRLCSRAPRMTNRSDTVGGYRRVATGQTVSSDRLTARTEVHQLVSQQRGLLEAQLRRRPAHLRFDLVHEGQHLGCRRQLRERPRL